MPFEKGKPKTGGRQSGAPNKATSELRDQLQLLVETTLDDLPEQLATMDLGERIRLVTGLLPYVMPKLSTIGITATVDIPESKPGATIRVWTAENINEFDKWCQQQSLPSRTESITPPKTE